MEEMRKKNIKAEVKEETSKSHIIRNRRRITLICLYTYPANTIQKSTNQSNSGRLIDNHGNWNGQPSRSSAGIGFRTGVLVVHHFQHNQTKEYELIIDPNYLTTVSAAGSIVLRNPKELMGGLGGTGGEQGDGMEERLVRVKDGKKMLVRRPNDPRKADKVDLEGESIDFVPGEQNMEEGGEFTVTISPDYVEMLGMNGNHVLRSLKHPSPGKEERERGSQKPELRSIDLSFCLIDLMYQRNVKMRIQTYSAHRVDF
ncbi:hypothetical protein BLNAU_20207 [Blattamonas nauphoetae]|uniref:Uncharacterized protein n=1 Tax=Blattamonas nauphoetae TaxID=2049346 RepID=A0ABQ9WZD3_9EUKA|nr:hypothetical protein BLNAU_20207 [Blattamonas nauphoetae]